MGMALRTTTDSDVWQYVDRARSDYVTDVIRRAATSATLEPAGIISVARFEELWRSVLDRCAKLTTRPGYRSAGAWSPDGRGCEVLMSQPNADGTETVWHVSAHEAAGNRRISTQVKGPWTDSHDGHWRRLAEGDRSRSVVVDHHYYNRGPGGRGGMGGAPYRIRMLADGSIVECSDMWFAGVVPPSWRERFPDNAVFEVGHHPTFTG
jgi:hypothetical protein